MQKLLFIFWLLMMVAPGGIAATGCIEGDCRNGTGTKVAADGTRYTGDWKDGKYHGFGTLTLSEGDRYVGDFRMGKRYLGTLYRKDGSRFVGHELHGIRHGEGIEYSGSGEVIQQGSWKYGKFIRSHPVQIDLNPTLPESKDGPGGKILVGLAAAYVAQKETDRDAARTRVQNANRQHALAAEEQTAKEQKRRDSVNAKRRQQEETIAETKQQLALLEAHREMLESKIVPDDAPQVIRIPGSTESITAGELKRELASDGLKLVKNNRLKPDECALFYPRADEKDLAASFGALTCAHQIGNHVELRSTAVYGGCNASNPIGQGLGAACEVGVVRQDLEVAIPGGTTNFQVQGPAADACASISSEAMCMNAGATLASTSFSIKDSHGSGIGFTVEKGVGYGIGGGYDDGILHGSLNLKFIAGGSISFSLNTEQAGRAIYDVADQGYVLVRDEVVAAALPVAEQFGHEIIRSGEVVVTGLDAGGREVIKVANQTGTFLERDVANAFESAGRTLGEGVVDVGNEIGKGVVVVGNEIGKGVVGAGKEIGKGLEDTGKVLEKGVNEIGKALGL